MSHGLALVVLQTVPLLDVEPQDPDHVLSMPEERHVETKLATLPRRAPQRFCVKQALATHDMWRVPKPQLETTNARAAGQSQKTSEEIRMAQVRSSEGFRLVDNFVVDDKTHKWILHVGTRLSSACVTRTSRMGSPGRGSAVCGS